jgi:hypothetical protein
LEQATTAAKQTACDLVSAGQQVMVSWMGHFFMSSMWFFLLVFGWTVQSQTTKKKWFQLLNWQNFGMKFFC